MEIQDKKLKVNLKDELIKDNSNKPELTKDLAEIKKTSILNDSVIQKRFINKINTNLNDSDLAKFILDDVQKFDLLTKRLIDEYGELKKIDLRSEKNRNGHKFTIDKDIPNSKKAEIGLNSYEKNFTKRLFNQISEQLRFDKRNKTKTYHVISKEDKTRERLKRMKDIRHTDIAGVIHVDNDGNYHDTIGSIIYDNRLIYKLHDNPNEYLKLVKDKQKFFHRDGSIEEVYTCDENLPYTIKYPLKFDDDIKSILLDIGHSINMLAREWMSREILAYTKGNQKMFAIIAIVCLVIGIGIGLLL